MGFVTDDLDAAQERLGRRFGVTRFRDQLDTQRMSKAHAYAGDMKIEIIQPGPNAFAVYHKDVPTGGAVRLHHLRYLYDDVPSN